MWAYKGSMMKGSTIEVVSSTMTLDGSIIADQIQWFMEKIQEDPLKVREYLRDFYLHGVREGVALTGQKVKSITERGKPNEELSPMQ